MTRHDSLADQLLELHALQEARITAEEEARVRAAEEARRREEAAAERRREAEEAERQRAEAQALAEARALREAEAQRALQAREAQLRIQLELEAKAQEAELRQALERETEARVKGAMATAHMWTRRLAAIAVAVVVASVGVYAWVLRPELQRQQLRLEGTQQEAEFLRKENARLEDEVDALGKRLEERKLDQPSPTEPRPRKKRPPARPAAGRKAAPPTVNEPKCANENDPLCGISL